MSESSIELYYHVLHPDYLDDVSHGEGMMNSLETSARRSAGEVAEMSVRAPKVSIVIRTHNDAGTLEGLFDDLDDQKYAGEMQIIVADLDSTDTTRGLAQDLGANIRKHVEIIPIERHGFNYPKGMNTAIEAARHPYIFTTVGHARLSNNRTLDAVARAALDPHFGGAYGPALPNLGASWAEKRGAAMLGVTGMFEQPKIITASTLELGVLASDRAVIRKEALQAVGGYSEAFAAGGEDFDLARRFLNRGWIIIRDPVLAQHHTHGLDPVRSVIQYMDWRRITNGPHPYSPAFRRMTGLPQF